MPHIHNRLIAVLALLVASQTATAQPLPDLSKTEIKVTQVAGNVYMLQGSDAGNIAALVGEDGIVLVDDEYAPLAAKIAAALKGIGVTNKPVRFIINTHYHYDHTGGNLAFGSQGTTIIAHDNARARLASGGAAGNGGTVHFDMPPAKKAALPVITFDHDVSVHLDGEDIRALHYPAGHTDGDAIIFFPKANVVHMGDDYVRYGFPFIDVQAGGSVEGMIKACEGAIEKLPPDVKIIPGHGEVSTVTEVREYVKMLKGASAVIEGAIKAGKTLDQMKRERLLAPWSATYSNDFVDTDAFIDTLYNSLTHQQYTKYLKHN
jgi:glyoxylase-like metal-dependent hydrolase (beta-lactamase superfamily II)